MFFKKQTGESPWLIVGLGNPEKKYDGTRHNAGFEALDIFCKNQGISLNKSKFKAVYGEGKVGNKKVIAAKPQTYMNLSGEAVAPLARFYKIPPEKIVVICDDISLDVGKIRLRSSGSAGGHNGLKNIIALLGGEAFPRVKIGVGKKPHPDYELVDWVLGKVPKEQHSDYTASLCNAADSVELMLKTDIATAMNRYN